MIYEWRCQNCGKIQEIQRSVQDYEVPPDAEHQWQRIIRTAPGVPFLHLRDTGVFMDEHGNYPPRKLD